MYMQNKKEKLQKDLIVRVQPSLFKKFQNKCTNDYKSISQVIRDFMIQYTNEKR
jgi:hypothetical protein